MLYASESSVLFVWGVWGNEDLEMMSHEGECIALLYSDLYSLLPMNSSDLWGI